MLQHDTEGQATDNTPIYAGQHRIQRLKAVNSVDTVDQQRTDRHGVQRAEQHIPSQQLQTQHEQRHIHHQRHNAHRKIREKGIYDLCYASQATEGHMAGHTAPAKTECVQRTAEGDNPILFQFFICMHIPTVLSCYCGLPAQPANQYQYKVKNKHPPLTDISTMPAIHTHTRPWPPTSSKISVIRTPHTLM